jgi:hypothetical protein
LPRALIQPRSRNCSIRRSNRRRSAPWPSRRLRNSERTEKSKPVSVNSRLKTYFQSMRVRTASAAWRSVNPSAYYMRVTRARRQGASAGCPRMGNRSRKSSSVYNVPNSSRIRRNTLPFGRTALATRVVSSGIAGIGWGCMDIGFLLGSSTLCLSFSISHSFLSLLEQFANNILVWFYRSSHLLATQPAALQGNVDICLAWFLYGYSHSWVALYYIDTLN